MLHPDHLFTALEDCVKLYYGACAVRGMPLPQGVPVCSAVTDDIEWASPVYDASIKDHILTWWVAAAGCHLRWVLEHADAIANRIVGVFGTTHPATYHLDLACATFRQWFPGVDDDAVTRDAQGRVWRTQMEAFEWVSFVPRNKRMDSVRSIAALDPPRHCKFGCVPYDGAFFVYPSGYASPDVHATRTHNRYYERLCPAYVLGQQPRERKRKREEEEKMEEMQEEGKPRLAPVLRKRAHPSCMGNLLEGCCGFC